MDLAEIYGIEVNDIFRVIDLTGVLLNGILGGKLARTKHFDAVGFVILAIMSAMGGGIVRDVMLQHGPPVALTDPLYISTALVGAGIAFFWKLSSRFWRIAFIIADGTVLGCWAATGAMKTLALGFGIMPALLLGITTAVGGGMIRDVTAGNVPMVFGGNNLYATPALVSAAIMVLLYSLGSPTGGSFWQPLSGRRSRLWRTGGNGSCRCILDWSLAETPAQLKARLELRARENPQSGTPRED